MKKIGSGLAVLCALTGPGLFAASASATVEDIYVTGPSTPGQPYSRACNYVGAQCEIVARLIGADNQDPVVITINGTDLGAPRYARYTNRSAAFIEWRAPALGTYTVIAEQGTSTSTLVINITEPSSGTGSALLPSGSAG
ncbi:transposase family protein [Nocardia sp. NPDC058518]|uniref:transposase family protein n=1 Tax=Nocardia sp. NPDC058518 TaxID=3346534 RepID=UPI003655E97F